MWWPQRLLVGAVLIAGCVPGWAVHPANADDSAGQLKAFKDWVVGCDNLRRCTALGLMKDGGSDGYIVVQRDGLADAGPRLTFSVLTQSPLKSPVLSVSIDGKPARGDLHWPAKVVDPYAKVTLSGSDAASIIERLKSAKGLTLNLKDAQGSETDTASVSLAGSVAALLYMDDQQLRVGTETALVKKGTTAASSIPMPPAAPVIEAQIMTELPLKSAKGSQAQAQTAPIEAAGRDLDLPDALTLNRDESCEGYASMALQMPGGKIVWGVCESAAAYNFDYSFWITRQRDGKTTTPDPATFTVPAALQLDQMSNLLTNPGLSRDGRLLTAFEKGRGLGDCGTLSEWAFDGSAFRLVSYATMTACNGVSPDDWPVLYTARVK